MGACLLHKRQVLIIEQDTKNEKIVNVEEPGQAIRFGICIPNRKARLRRIRKNLLQILNATIRRNTGGMCKMKATGIVRRIDDLGRIVIPKEIRRTLRIREGDPLEIYTEKDGEVIFKKYSPMGDLEGFAGEICESLHKTIGATCAICDRDGVIAAAGGRRRELLDKPISPALERVMENRGVYVQGEGAAPLPVTEAADSPEAALAAPILSAGDVMGCVVLLAQEGRSNPGETERKLAEMVAGFLGRQMEE